MVRPLIKPGLRDFRIYEEIWKINYFENFPYVSIAQEFFSYLSNRKAS